MKFYITYFYNVRFLKPNQIPFSTAVWDPKWFHDNQNQDYKFLDKNNVWNGYRVEPLHPKLDNDYCINCDHSQHGNCEFTKKYKSEIFKVNFQLLLNYFKQTANSLKINNPEFILLVHEKPDNPCSERASLIEYFKSNNVDLIELKEENHA